MPTPEVLRPSSVSIRKLPFNYDPTDAALFSHALEATIPATILLELNDIILTPLGILMKGSRALPESFPTDDFIEGWIGRRYQLKAWWERLKRPRHLSESAVFFTDLWSRSGYFHWMTDALPRLFAIRDRIADKTLLLPGYFRGLPYLEQSLQPFDFRDLQFIDASILCERLTVPTRTAPTGNFNEALIQEMREFFTRFYGESGSGANDRIYISRSKSWARRIVNEAECLAVLASFGFETVYFEECSLEQQVKIASSARYLVSNHGAGLTNMLFMPAGGAVLELRKRGDAHNNCYFALACAAGLNPFYQLCDIENPAADTDAADLVVNPQLLGRNLEKMLAQ